VEQAINNLQLDLGALKDSANIESPNRSNSDLPTYIAVEGPIGVGKTSLARQLAHKFNYDTLLENSQQNPFLERFYKDPERAALPTQLHFLFQRAQLLGSLHQGDIFQPALIADFILEKDPLFAEATLDTDELALYQNVYQQMTIETPKPDLVIYLQAPTEVLEERLSMTAPNKTPRFSFEFLRRLNDAYTNFFYYYDEAPLLIINTADINPVDNSDDLNNLVEYVSQVKSGRHYYNPQASS